MSSRAQQLARERHLSNTEFHMGDVQRLPFADESFSIVVTRLAFHHSDALGICARHDGDTIRFTYPVAICTARRST